ncbi:DUF4440 domain-containing protein [Chitinophaga lutea]
MRSLITPVFFLLSFSAAAQRAIQADAATLARLQQFRQVYAAALTSAQPEKLAASFADSIRLMPESQWTVWTKENVLLYYQAFLRRFKVAEYRSEVLEVMDLGKMVIVFGTFSQTLVQSPNERRDTIHGKYTDIWRRESNGQLNLVTQAWNYSHPVAIQLSFPDVPAVNMAYQQHLPVKDPLSFELAAYNSFQEGIISEHDGGRWKQFYTDDFLFLYSNHPPVKGRQEIDAFLDDHVKHLPVFEKLDIRTDRIEDLDGYVIEYASHIAIVRSGDWSGVVTGKNIYVWRREKSGVLRICRGVAMYD